MNLILGVLLLQMKEVQIWRKEVKKEEGICMGMVCSKYSKRVGMVILRREALPNQETLRTFQHFNYSLVSFRAGVKLN